MAKDIHFVDGNHPAASLRYGATVVVLPPPSVFCIPMGDMDLSFPTPEGQSCLC